MTFNLDVAPWAGSFLQGRHDVDGLGFLAELPVRERAPGQAAFDLSTAARYGAAAIWVGFSRERSANESRVTAHLVQELSTVAMASPQRRPAVFTDGFTQAALDEQVPLDRITPDNVPVHVFSITFG